MKKIIILSLVTLFTGNLFAQSSATATPAKASTIQDKLQKIQQQQQQTQKNANLSQPVPANEKVLEAVKVENAPVVATDAKIVPDVKPAEAISSTPTDVNKIAKDPKLAIVAKPVIKKD